MSSGKLVEVSPPSANRGLYYSLQALVAGFILCTSVLASDTHQHTEGRKESLSPGVPQNLNVAFELLDRNSNLVTAEDYTGKYLLITFGFTHCAHICPTLVSTLSQVIRSSDRVVEGIFVSVDTERDTTVVVDNYAKQFHSKISGLGGSYAQVNQTARNFGVKYTVIKSQDGYSVQHTSYIYLIGPNGKLIDIFALNATPETILLSLN